MRAALVRMVEARAAMRRAAIVAALGDAGVDALVEGEDVVAAGRGLRGRWLRDLALREAGRGR
jgi:hypothetical protein